MNKNVVISLMGLQYAVEEEEAPIEVINFGQYYKKGDKRHYKVINIVCGIFLILVGVMMMTGLFARLSAMLA